MDQSCSNQSSSEQGRPTPSTIGRWKEAAFGRPGLIAFLAAGVASIVLFTLVGLATAGANREARVEGEARDAAAAIALACRYANEKGDDVRKYETEELVNKYPDSSYKLEGKYYLPAEYRIVKHAYDEDGKFSGIIVVEPAERSFLSYQPPTIIYDFSDAYDSYVAGVIVKD